MCRAFLLGNDFVSFSVLRSLVRILLKPIFSLTKSISNESQFFISFEESIDSYSLPEKFTFPFNYQPHPLCLVAAKELQLHLTQQKEWEHNFGLEEGKEGAIIGKMFGVLLVRNAQNEIGYLAAFSGKLAGGYHHAKFVPPVYDSLLPGSFLNIGMLELTYINQEIKHLESQETEDNLDKIYSLKQLRKNNSIALQDQLFDQYYFLNRSGEEKSLRAIFRNSRNQKPVAGAGDCAAPKLLQFAFQNNLEPLAMAEFWWGLSPKSAFWKHGHFYPACREKCEPILRFMLDGVEMEEKPETRLPN
jgi:tRNA pseudouridine32 synthase/23S rRNA pseudouridine746 synthase